LKKALLLIFCLLIDCSSTEKNIGRDEYSSRDDAVSNYILFEYIDLLTEEDYYALLDSVKNGLSNDFFSLRMSYTKTGIYDPYNSELDDLRKKIRLSIEEKKFNKALEFANKIFEKRYIDIKAHLYCSYIYEQLNDSAASRYHYDIYNGLMNSIYLSGDGEGYETAFIVMEVSEEYDLLRWLELRLQGQSLVVRDGYSFDIMKVFDENIETELFFNIDLALKRFSEEFD
jgi:hypothetical protein